MLDCWLSQGFIYIDKFLYTFSRTLQSVAKCITLIRPIKNAANATKVKIKAVF